MKLPRECAGRSYLSTALAQRFGSVIASTCHQSTVLEPWRRGKDGQSSLRVAFCSVFATFGSYEAIETLAG
jgi:hypothetical protein